MFHFYLFPCSYIITLRMCSDVYGLMSMVVIVLVEYSTVSIGTHLVDNEDIIVRCLIVSTCIILVD